MFTYQNIIKTQHSTTNFTMAIAISASDLFINVCAACFRQSVQMLRCIYVCTSEVQVIQDILAHSSDSQHQKMHNTTSRQAVKMNS